MCGINIAIINFKNIDRLAIICKKIEKSLEYQNNSELLDSIHELKNNHTYYSLFINFKYFSKKLKEIKENIIQKLNFNNINQILINDIEWIIEQEIINKAKKINKLITKYKLDNNFKTVILIKNILFEIDSLNYLESRGRDSASLTINLISKNKLTTKLKNNYKGNDSNIIINLYKNKQYNCLSLTLKYAERIGYSGQNAEKLFEYLIKSKLLESLIFKNIEFSSIISHTRWASVGNVNLSNCHPLINRGTKNIEFFYMNGDILNYQHIYNSNLKKKINILEDENCSNDLKCLPNEYKNNKKKLNGSFVIVNHNSLNLQNININKTGSQGFYSTYNNDDDCFFSSDVYGLVNKSNYFYSLNFTFDCNFSNKNFKSFLYKNSFKQKTDILSSDLDKNEFDFFYLKEINDTEKFLFRSANKYINFDKKKLLNLSNIFSSKTNKLIKNNKIRNIIFTGMGSCYTAAVGVSKFLQNELNISDIYNIKVEATMASEGSGFYIAEKMYDTIIVVLAQSGTTIDTNVYARLAKERGAYIISIVNKKDGDITFIADSNIYLGIGRDVELSVPSTKTYVLHLLIGYLVSKKISNIFSKNNKNHTLIKTYQDIISQNYISRQIIKASKNAKKININILKFVNWIIVTDESENSFCSLEARIKLSECCYKTVPYMSVKELNKLNIKNALIIYVGTKKDPKIKISKNNRYIYITKNYNQKNSNFISYLLMDYNNKIEMSICTPIFIQYLAFTLAKKIDDTDSLKDKDKLIKFSLNKYELDYLLSKKIKDQKFFLKRKTIRAIDSIMHQAKTVTVGAIRQPGLLETNKQVIIDNYEIKKFPTKFNFRKDGFSIYLDEKNEIISYYFGNIIDFINQKSKKNLHFIFYKKEKIIKNFDKIYIKNISENKKLVEINNKKITLKNEENLLEFMLQEKEYIDIFKNFSASKNILDTFFNNYFINLNEEINKFKNVKFLGSGLNYLVAKKYAKKFSKILNKAIAYDVIENHKHIDISSEALIIIFASNINRAGFQQDVYSEIEKFIAHNNYPIIFSNEDNNIFEKLLENRIFGFSPKLIKLPKVYEILTLPFFDFYFEKYFSKF